MSDIVNAWRIDFGVLESMPRFEYEGQKRPHWVWGTGRLVTAPPVPTAAIQQDRHKLTDVFRLPGASAVSGRFRALIEQFEPGVHQFFPITLKAKSGEPIDEEYYILNVTQMFDAILFAASDVTWPTKEAGPFEGMPLVGTLSEPFRVSKKEVSGRHLWRNHLITNHGVMVSDDLHAAFVKNKFRHLTLLAPFADHFEEVDVDFNYDIQAPHMMQWLDQNKSIAINNLPLEWIMQYRPQWRV